MILGGKSKTILMYTFCFYKTSTVSLYPPNYIAFSYITKSLFESKLRNKIP